MRNNIKKNSKKTNKDIIDAVAFLVFLFPLFNNAIIPQQGNMSLVLYIMQAISLAVIFVRSEKSRLTKRNLLAPFFVVLFLVLTLFNNAYIINEARIGLYTSQLFYLVSAVILSFRKINTKSLLWALNILYIEHIAVSVIALLLPNFYSSAILPIICKNDNPCHARSHFLEGLNPGFSKHYTTNAIILSLSSVQYFILSQKRKSAKDIVALIISLALLLSVGKRTHFAITVAVIIIYYFKTGSEKISQKFKKIVLGFLALIITIAGYLIAVTYIPSLSTTFTRFQQYNKSDDITNGRTLLWDLAVENWKENPILGKGWGSYGFDSNKYKYIYNTEYIEAHNDYLQMLAELGIIGTTIYLLVLISLIYSKNKELKVNPSYYSSFAYLYLLYFCMYGLTGHPLHTTLTFALLTIFSFIKNNPENNQ